MIMMQISREKKQKLSDYTEKVLHYAGKLMQCVESLESEDGFGERSNSRYMGMDHDEDYDHEEGYGDRWRAYGDRRGVRGTGPYSRYR